MKGHEQLGMLFMAKSGWYHGASQASVPGRGDGGFLFEITENAFPQRSRSRASLRRTPKGTPQSSRFLRPCWKGILSDLTRGER